mgnify:CR=1 FL=1
MSQLPFKKTKILATIGPASNSYEMIKSLAFAGANVFRLNFSHGSHEVHKEVLETIRKVNQELNCNLGILQDLQGPKIRVGEVENNGVEINPGDKINTITNIKKVIFNWSLNLAERFELHGANGPWYALQRKIAD